MRLINTDSLEMEEFVGDIPQYAILSHTWGSNEVSYQDYRAFLESNSELASMDGAGFAKIRGLCLRAQQQDLEWAWIDTCCIDKTSSAELSEAINSMWNWYRNSTVCYAYLGDIGPIPAIPSSEMGSDGLSHIYRLHFRTSRWFSRGWTLQELLAPNHIEFLARDWTEIGTKCSLLDLLADTTGIRRSALETPGEISRASVAERMRWASQRETTRPEDVAYSLFGIFGVNLPLLYGEGDRAFLRLQEEILRTTEDYTIFAWSEHRIKLYDYTRFTGVGVLATDPRDFEVCHLVTLRNSASGSPSPVLTRLLDETFFGDSALRQYMGKVVTDEDGMGQIIQRPVIEKSDSGRRMLVPSSHSLPASWNMEPLSITNRGLRMGVLARLESHPTASAGHDIYITAAIPCQLEEPVDAPLGIPLVVRSTTNGFNRTYMSRSISLIWEDVKGGQPVMAERAHPGFLIDLSGCDMAEFCWINVYLDFVARAYSDSTETYYGMSTFTDNQLAVRLKGVTLVRAFPSVRHIACDTNDIQPTSDSEGVTPDGETSTLSEERSGETPYTIWDTITSFDRCRNSPPERVFLHIRRSSEAPVADASPSLKRPDILVVVYGERYPHGLCYAQEFEPAIAEKHEKFTSESESESDSEWEDLLYPPQGASDRYTLVLSDGNICRLATKRVRLVAPSELEDYGDEEETQCLEVSCE